MSNVNVSYRLVVIRWWMLSVLKEIHREWLKFCKNTHSQSRIKSICNTKNGPNRLKFIY